MKKIKRNRTKKLISLSAVLCVFLIGGTFAYFSDWESKQNLLDTGKFDSKLDEKFVSPSNWKPGEEVEKQVQVQNTGTVDMVAVVKIKESCVRREDITYKKYNQDSKEFEDVVVSKAGEILPVVFTGSDGKTEQVGVKEFGKDVVVYDESADPSSYDGKWVYLPDYTDSDNGFGYMLYMGVIKSGGSSPHLLESVTMNDQLKNTVASTNEVHYFDKESKTEKTTYTYELNEYGYDLARYELDIQAATLQATAKAIQNEWGHSEDLVPEVFQGLLIHLQELCGK